MIFNKVDKLAEISQEDLINDLRNKYTDAIFISAAKGINLSSLFEKVFAIINKELLETEINVPVSIPDVYKIINRLHSQIEILETKYLSRFIRLKVRGYKSEIAKAEQYLEKHKNDYKSSKNGTQTNRRKAIARSVS